MNTIAILAIWLLPALVVVLLMARNAYSVMLCVRHSFILYAFCRVRDEIALKAIAGEISEDSQVFEFLYTNNALIIHENQDHGLCYSNLFEKLLPWDPGRKAKPNGKLFREIESSSTEVKILASHYANAVCYAMVSSYPLILRNTMVKLLLTLISRVPLISKKKRESADLSLGLANALASAAG